MPKVTMIPATINPKTRLPEMIRAKKTGGRLRSCFHGQRRAVHQLCSADGVLHKPDQRQSGLGICPRLYGRRYQRFEYPQAHRFQRMIDDALAGHVDLIVTKSVNRFAKNTVDSLKTIRELKKAGTEVYFKKENIYTFDDKGELLLTIMSSLAQEESRSISENVTWGQRKRFSDGKVSLPYKQFLGYERGENKNDPPVVNPEQAVIVRRIYRSFMEGKIAGAIAK